MQRPKLSKPCVEATHGSFKANTQENGIHMDNVSSVHWRLHWQPNVTTECHPQVRTCTPALCSGQGCLVNQQTNRCPCAHPCSTHA